MARETSCFERWRQEVEAIAETRGALAAFNAATALAGTICGTRMTLVLIKWRRKAKEFLDDMAASNYETFRLTSRFAIGVSDWGRLAEDERSAFVAVVRSLVVRL